MDGQDQILESANKQNINEGIKKHSFVFYFYLFIFLIALDQLTKYYFFKFYVQPWRQSLGITPLNNSGVLFGLPFSANLSLPLYVVALVILLWYVNRHYSKMGTFHKMSWTLILAGGSSNFFERLVTGSVKDFLYILTGVFNFADGMILLGVLMLLWSERK